MLLHLFTIVTAWNCAPQDVQNCLIAFETQFQAACASTDYACQCDNVLEQGTKCFDDCPDAALDDFITTYADGVCRKAAEVQLDVDATRGEHRRSRRGNETHYDTKTNESEGNHESHASTSSSISSSTSAGHSISVSATSSAKPSSSVSPSLSSQSSTTSKSASGTKASREEAMELLSNSSLTMTIDEHERTNHDASPFSKLKWSMFAAMPIALVLIII